MVSYKLSQIYKQYPCSFLSLFVVIYEIRYDLPNNFWYYRTPFIDTLNLINISDSNSWNMKAYKIGQTKSWKYLLY